jgi:hypothetical protein
MTPQEFIAKWRRTNLTERSAYQQHFLDLCKLLGQPEPAEVDPDGTWYTFERGVRKVEWSIGLAHYTRPLGYKIWCLHALQGEHHVVARCPGSYRVWYYGYRMVERLKREA